jgi:transcriptional regulator with XRE-family HTH domain
MASFGKKIAELRKEHKMSQTDLAKKLSTSVSVISRYERDEMTPSIDVARKLATILNTTVGYLLSETDQEDVLKDPGMLKRLNDIERMEPAEKDHVLFTLDALIQKIKLKNIAAL